MNPITPILNKILVREFYRANATLFFIAIGIAAGFMRSQDHIALGELFISSPILLLIPVSIWTIYTFHIIKFNRGQIRRKENEFVFGVILLRTVQQWSVYTFALSCQLLPVIFYSVFLFVLASLKGIIVTALLTGGASLVLIVIASQAISTSLHHPNQEKKQSVFEHFLQTYLTKPFSFFFIEWMVKREPLVLIGTKFFGTVILFGVTQLYKSDVYDLRLLGMGIVITCAAQANVVREIHRFDNRHFLILRNLPLSLTRRLAYLGLTILILMLPEGVILLKNLPSHFTIFQGAVAILFLLSVPHLFYGMLYAKEKSQEQLTSIVFLSAIGWIIVILFKVPVLVIATVNFFLGILWFKKYRYSFEYSAKME